MSVAAKPSGKLDNIKNIKDHVDTVNGLISRVRESRGTVEAVLLSLRTAARDLVAGREEEVRRAEKQKQYDGLRKQREEERKTAEAIIDQRSEELAKARTEAKEAKAKKESEAAAKATEVTPAPRADHITKPQPPMHPRGAEPVKFPSRTEFPRGTSDRPPFGQRGGQQGGQQRTWTPSQSTGAYGRGLGRPENPNVGRPGYAPRPGGPGGYGPRPGGPGGFAPRPGFGPRPGGLGGALGARPGGATGPTEKFVPKTNTYDARGKKKFDGEKSGGMDRRALLRRGIIEEQDIEERMLTRVFRNKKSKENARGQTKIDLSVVKINSTTITVKTLSEKIGKTATEIIKQLMVLGEMCTINSTITFEMAELVAAEFGITLELHADKTFEEQMSDRHSGTEDEADLVARPPVVTVMGHVDHGKTTLLDTLRKTKVTASEAGGITQHIGSYQVELKGKKITFIDTPGHAAFDKMRARGAKITDIAILIVAGDDGVMPQTVEAIKHIQGQDLPMVVAVNKMDKPEFNLDRVKQQLSEHNVIPEEWGGNAIIVPISAHSGEGTDKLLEMILLVADMNGYRANPNKEASGSIIEAQLDKTRGPVVTVLVQSGTLKVGDTLLAGTTYGKVKTMTDENGKKMRKAGPSTPVQVLGFSEVPKAGDMVYVVDEKLTKQVVEERRDKEKVKKTKQLSTTDSEHAFEVMQEAEKTQLNVIVKGDVAGSVEAIIQTLHTITSDEVSVNVISSGVGNINDNDVALADMADARLIAFQTKITATAKDRAKKAKVTIHEFKIIYEIFDFVTNEMVKLFKPKFIDKYFGKAEVLQIFRSSAVGIIAGCRVIDGKIYRNNARVKLHRGGDVLGEFKIESLKIKTNDAKEVASGHECGIRLDGAPPVQPGDIFECLGQEQLPIMFNGRKYEF